MKEEQFRGKKERRPHLASDCDNLADAERWRRQIIKQVSKKISMIQNGLIACPGCHTLPVARAASCPSRGGCASTPSSHRPHTRCLNCRRKCP